MSHNNRDIEVKVRQTIFFINDTLQSNANQPSLAFYRFQEHLDKTTPQMIQKYKELNKCQSAFDAIQFDMQYGLEFTQKLKNINESLEIKHNFPMPLIMSNSHVRRTGIIATASTFTALGIAYLIWKTFFRRTQNEESGRKFCRGPLIRASSFDEWENARDDTSTTEALPTPQQLYRKGLEHMNVSIDCWQRALAMIDYNLRNSIIDQYTRRTFLELKEKVEFLLKKHDTPSKPLELNSIVQQEQENDSEYQSVPSSNSFIRDRFLASNQHETSRAQHDLRTAMSIQSDLSTFTDHRSLRSIVSNDSFQSCPDEVDWLDSADLIFDPSSPYYSLPAYYVYGLRLAEKNQIPYRKLRTKVLNCSSNTDYLAKLYCIRNACDEILNNDEKKNFLKRISREICERLLEKASKDKTRFIEAFEHINALLSDENRWPSVHEELTAAGIKSPTVYNVAIDFMLLEGFEILDSPPSAMRTILQNSWFSESFREQALYKAVACALKVRRATAKNADGFLTSFLSLIEDIAPLFAWGILGPESSIKPTCLFLKDSVLDFARSLYDFEQTDYSSLTTLATDVDRQINNLLLTITREFDIDQSLIIQQSRSHNVHFT